MLSLKDLINMGVLPSGTKELNFNPSTMMYASDYEKLNVQERKSVIPILDNATWIAHTNKYYYSYSEEYGIGKSTQGASKIMLNSIKGNTLRPSGVYNLIKNDSTIAEAHEAYLRAKASGRLDRILKNKGERNMENNNTFNFDEIDSIDNLDAVSNSALEEASANLQATTNNIVAGGETAKLNIGGEVKEEPQTAIDSAELEFIRNESRTAKKVAQFNNRGRQCGLYCWIVDKPTFLRAAALKDTKNSNKSIGKDKAGHSTAVQKDAQSGNESTRVLRFKMERPGKIKGAVIKVKKGGIVNPSLYQARQYDKIEAQLTDETIVSLPVNIDVLKNFIQYSFALSMPELSETFGGRAGELYIDLKKPTQAQLTKWENDPSLTGEAPKREILTSTSRKTQLVIEGAYFPLKEFETIDMNDSSLSQDDIRLGNYSLFQHLYKAGKKSNVTQVEELTSIFAERLSATDGPDGKRIYSSTYFPESGSITLNQDKVVKYDKLMPNLTELRVPIKEEVEKKDGTGVRVVTRTLNCLKPSEDPAKLQLDSLHSGRYQELINGAPDALNLEQLTKVFKPARAKAGSKTRVDYSNEALMHELMKNKRMKGNEDDIINIFNDLQF